MSNNSWPILTTDKRYTSVAWCRGRLAPGNRVDLTDHKIGRLHGKLSDPALRKLLGLPLPLLDMVADKSFRSITEDIAMANEPFESLTGIEQYVQVTERTKHAMETYFSWLPNVMSASRTARKSEVVETENSTAWWPFSF